MFLRKKCGSFAWC